MNKNRKYKKCIIKIGKIKLVVSEIMKNLFIQLDKEQLKKKISSRVSHLILLLKSQDL